MIRRLSYVALIWASIGLPVWAQTQSNKTIFTLDQLIQLALESNPQVMAARDQTRAIGGQLRSARAIPNPEFEVS